MIKGSKVVIVGSGGIGSAAGLMLRELGDWGLDIYLGDARIEAAHAAAKWITKGSSKSGLVKPFQMPEEGSKINARMLSCKVRSTPKHFSRVALFRDFIPMQARRALKNNRARRCRRCPRSSWLAPGAG